MAPLSGIAGSPALNNSASKKRGCLAEDVAATYQNCNIWGAVMPEEMLMQPVGSMAGSPDERR
jgi:hypothetical protein